MRPGSLDRCDRFSANCPSKAFDRSWRWGRNKFDPMSFLPAYRRAMAGFLKCAVCVRLPSPSARRRTPLPKHSRMHTAHSESHRRNHETASRPNPLGHSDRHHPHGGSSGPHRLVRKVQISCQSTSPAGSWRCLPNRDPASLQSAMSDGHVSQISLAIQPPPDRRLPRHLHAGPATGTPPLIRHA